jgi:hypothetical protein
MSDSVFAVGESPAEITGIPNVASVLVLNSGHVDVIVDNKNDVTLTPQSGCRIEPGQLVPFPRNGMTMQLFAVAAGAGGKVTVVIFPTFPAGVFSPEELLGE